MSFPCEIAIRPSASLMAGLVVGHLVLGAAFLASSLPVYLVGLALAGLAINAAIALRRWREGARTHFLLRLDGTLQVTPPNAEPYEATAAPDCRVFGWAVWLAWRGNEGAPRGILLIPRDALTAEAWRILRVWLGFRSHPMDEEGGV
jgi:hypothetical protein